MWKLYMISAKSTWYLWLAICWMLIWSLPSAQSLKHDHICGNLDIRNNVEELKSLKDCSIIDGSLTILLMEKTSFSSFRNLSFPNLIEIKDYLMFYRIHGLQSIGQLFPNLAIIRGSKLFYNYAFVIYDMPNLREISLGNLTHILRGSVRIEKNPNLCYIDTIDWDLIAKAGKNGHFMKKNQNFEDCFDICPHDGTQHLCPFSEEKQTHLCWNRYSCQKVCSRQCEKENRTCAQPTACCHPQCLGGCTGSEATDCIACKTVVYKSKCLESCPSSLFQFNGRCINVEECKNLPVPKRNPPVYYKPWKVENKARSGQCSLECPHGYIPIGKHGCRKCEKSCPKVCPGLKIDNLATAQKLSDCTEISGSLTVQIPGNGGSVSNELEKFLGKIQSIDGYLKIAHSSPLMSLSFLKNLTLIKGNILDRGEFSFVVRGNENLQALWDLNEKTENLTILNGKPSFHLNPKLCWDVINKTMRSASKVKWGDTEISITSNGYKGACEKENMDIKIEEIGPTSAKLTFKNLKNILGDARTILSYVISYRDVKKGMKVSLFEGRDACSDGQWKVENIDASEHHDKHDFIHHLIPGLTPDTRYAIHVRTSVIDTEHTSGYSKMKYFDTKPDKPTPPVDLTVSDVSLDLIILKWKPPKEPNGKVDHYVVYWEEEIISKDEIWRQSFCEDLSITSKKKRPKRKKELPVESFKNITVPNGSCPCPKNKKISEADIKEQINFENYIHNAVFIKRLDSSESRKRRSILDKLSFQNQVSTIAPSAFSTSFSLDEDDTSPTISSTPAPKVFSEFSKVTSFSIKQLHHYTKYHIMVKACHAYDHNSKMKLCSKIVDIYIRTKPKPGADDIDFTSVQAKIDNHTSGNVFLQWNPPESPNGIINGYQVEYKRTDIDNFKPITVCITQEKFLESEGHFFKGLQPGKYSMRLQAISLSGQGSWTEYKRFEIIETKYGLATYVVILLVIIPIIIVVCMIAFGMWFYLKHKYNRRMAASSLFTSVNPEYLSTFQEYVPDEWEVPRDNVKLLHELGQGTFGMVYEGIITDPKTGEEFKCAIKTVNMTSSVREFLKEASVMKAFICHHVVRLRGVVSIKLPTLVLMELMENGDLRNYLRSQRPDYEPVDGKPKSPPTMARFIQMAAEIADGMEYLASNKFVHRDLAARNCMVARDLTVKIGDFGMTRDIYETDYYRKGGKGMLPVRWMAPESLKDGVFTSQSDVWSFGVVLWEMLTLACQPYQGLANEQVLKFVIEGGVIEKPVDCDEKMEKIMSSCWQYNPKMRPTFSELVENLSFGVSDNFKKFGFHFNKNNKQDSCSESEDEELLTPSTPLRNNTKNGDASTSQKSRNVSSKSSNHSSNGYVPCDNTGSTYC